uniref:Uncharacterized protein n=1 Tax=Arundo donax TaxID=35708 RepID=A0A0A9A1A7_ARUDO
MFQHFIISFSVVSSWFHAVVTINFSSLTNYDW